MDTIGARIRQARGIARLTQQQLADRVGVHVSAVKAWEGGHSNPNQARLAEIERVLQVNLHGAPTSDAPRVDEASHPRLLAELAERDAHNQDRIRDLEALVAELQAQLAAIRGDAPRPSRPRLVRPPRMAGRRLDPEDAPDTNGHPRPDDEGDDR